MPGSQIVGHCKARTRTNDSFLDQIDGQIKQVLEKRIQPRDSWRGHTLEAIDGTSMALINTFENQLADPQHKNSKEGCSFQKHDARIAPSLLKYIDVGGSEKATLGMEQFAGKTPEMAPKPLKMMIIAHNLLLTTMQEATQKAGKKVHEMSVRPTQ